MSDWPTFLDQIFSIYMSHRSCLFRVCFLIAYTSTYCSTWIQKLFRTLHTLCYSFSGNEVNKLKADRADSRIGCSLLHFSILLNDQRGDKRGLSIAHATGFGSCTRNSLRGYLFCLLSQRGKSNIFPMCAYLLSNTYLCILTIAPRFIRDGIICMIIEVSVVIIEGK